LRSCSGFPSWKKRGPAHCPVRAPRSRHGRWPKPAVSTRRAKLSKTMGGSVSSTFPTTLLLNRPGSSAFVEDAYPTIALKAAALLHSVAKNHALVDGNKRLAWLCTVVFCDLIGMTSHISDDDAFQFVWDATSSEIDLEEIAERLRLTN